MMRVKKQQIDEFYFKDCSGWFSTKESIRSIHFIVYSQDYGFPIGFDAPVSKSVAREVRVLVQKEIEAQWITESG